MRSKEVNKWETTIWCAQYPLWFIPNSTWDLAQLYAFKSNLYLKGATWFIDQRDKYFSFGAKIKIVNFIEPIGRAAK